MTPGGVLKVRLVKCPKCCRLLPEPPEVPVYECGGCRTVLRAKIIKSEANSTKIDLPERTIVPSKEVKDAVEETGSSSTGQNISQKDRLEVLKLPREVSASAKANECEIVATSIIKVSAAAAADDDGDDEQMDPAREITTIPAFESVISTVTSETTEQMTPDSDLSGALDDTPAPTTRCVSSSDESETMFKDAEFVGVQERLMRERGKFPMSAEVQDEGRSSSSSDIPDYITKYSEWSGDQPPKHPQNNTRQMKLDDNESLTVPFYLKNESPSTHWHDEFQGTSSLCSPENPSSYSQENIRLLRMVYKLQDQLDKAYVSGEQNVPTRGAYHNHEAFRDERYNVLGPFGHSRYPRSYKEDDEWSRQSRSSQLPFHGEAIDRDRFQADHQYPQCQCYIEPGRINHAHNCYSGVQSSRPPVHQPRMYSTIPSRDWDSKSDEMGYRADERRKFHSREQVQAAKKHYKPTAGGAPFISCYHCLQPLQLPADFLIFKRRCHKLRCGACTTVLNFSLENHNHILPFVPGNAFAPGEQSPVNRYKNPVNSDVEAEPSSSKSLSMNEKQVHGNAEAARDTKRVSRLHRLMGYTSASELLVIVHSLSMNEKQVPPFRFLKILFFFAFLVCKCDFL